MWTALTAEDPDRMRLHLAHHDGEILPAATMLTVGGHVRYSYGARVYDLRGITGTRGESNHLLGLPRLKAGTGSEAAEYLGEWDFPLNKPLHKAFQLRTARR